MNKESIDRDIPFISTNITRADIYLQGAVLHRHGTISLTRGRNRFGIKIPDYSPYEIELPRIEFGGKTEHCIIYIEYAYRVTYPKGKEISYEEEYGYRSGWDNSSISDGDSTGHLPG